MERTIFFVFLCTAVEAYIGKHVFISDKKTWLAAQAYCRQYHTDLSFVTSQTDEDKLYIAAGGEIIAGWIGLYREPNNETGWKWSGGGYITSYEDWAFNQPNNYENSEHYAIITPGGKWNDKNGEQLMPFYCFSGPKVGVKSTWEMALKHCRDNQTSLFSQLSDSQVQAQRLFQQANITEQVWIGLRYLAGHWLWVDGSSLVYKVWTKGGDQDHQCPIWKRCGALTKEGLWENRDCKDSLNFICN